MEYKKKIEYAERVAKELTGQKTSDQIKENLKAEGLYERDIANVFVSAKNIIGENYKPKIREFLLADKVIQNAEEFSSLDKDMLEKLIVDEKQKLGIEERKKMTKMIKEGHKPEEIFDKVDNRFLSPKKANEQLAKLEQVKNQNSGSGRMLNIGGGIGLIILTGIILLTTDRLFYVLPIIGLGLIVKGFLTEQMEFDN